MPVLAYMAVGALAMLLVIGCLEDFRNQRRGPGLGGPPAVGMSITPPEVTAAPALSPPPPAEPIEEPIEPPTRLAVGSFVDGIWKVYGPTSTGTAFVVGQDAEGRALLVTANHVVDDEGAEYEIGGGEFGEDVRFGPVEVLATDPDRDLAVLRSPAVDPYRAVLVSQWRTGAKGDVIRIGGYGAGAWSQHETTLAGSEIGSRDGSSIPAESWVAPEVTTAGHSGSPAVDARDHLVGVLTRGGGGRDLFAHARYVRWLLTDAGYEDLIDRRHPPGSSRD